MKKYIFLIVLLSVSVFIKAQYQKAPFAFPDSSSVLTRDLPTGSLILLESTANLYRLNTKATNTTAISTLFNNGSLDYVNHPDNDINQLAPENLAFGQSVFNIYQEKVLQNGGTYYPNSRATTIAKIHQLDLWQKAKFICIPSAIDSAKLFILKPFSYFNTSRSTTGSYINADGYITTAGINVPSVDYSTGRAVALIERQSTNLITHPISFGNISWEKVGAMIEGDPLTAGIEEFGTADNDWDVTSSQWSISGGVLSYTKGVNANVIHTGTTIGTYSLTTDQLYKVEFTIANSGNNAILAFQDHSGYPMIAMETYSDGHHICYFTASTDNNSNKPAIRGFNAGSNFDITDYSIKEIVNGYKSPHLESPYDLSGYKFTENGSTGQHYIESVLAGTTTDTNHVYSIYIKTGENTKFGFKEAAYTEEQIAIDVDSETVLTSTNIIVQFKDVAEGYKRCSFIFKSGLSGAIKARMYLLDDNYVSSDISTYSYTGTPGNGLFISFAQLEVGSYASSFITPTSEGATITRTGDVISEFSHSTLFNSVNNAGVLNLKIAAHSNDSTNRSVSLSDGTTTNSVILSYDIETNKVEANIIVDGSTYASLTYVVADETTFYNYSVRWGEPDGFASLWINGTEVATDATGTVFSLGTFSELSLNFIGNIETIHVSDYLNDFEMKYLNNQ